MIVVNGRVGGEIPATDRGLAYGDGVFRTFRAANGVPLQWARQYAKLAHDCRALRLVPPDREALARMHADYLACGIRERDDTRYMQQFQPDYVKRRPRW